MFEAARFDGSARLEDKSADFSGVFALVESGVQIATVKGTHDLDDGSGALTFEPTPLIFRPRVFEPADLSPLFRGPANVTGRIDLSGAATWDGEGLRTSATAELRRLGFALASAGVFEGVSGRIEVADLVHGYRGRRAQQAVGRLQPRELPGERAIRFRAAEDGPDHARGD